MVPPLRLFIALPPPTSVLTQLERVGHMLHRQCGGRRVRTDLLHVTLAFLGDTPIERLNELISVFNMLQHASIFALQLDCYGIWRRSGIGWCAPQYIPPPLIELHQRINQGLTGLGLPTETRPFKPHITLLRKALHAPNTEMTDAIIWQVDRFALMASELQADGPHYSSLAEWPLLSAGR
ncbi:RNA 2',3'-cyclic phosphodiesterase [Chitinivorax sp. B]|uniref:RNA 2',3'-cyclic phosphodiesterase n=1 Tax=Chitinivorax sp. B TaxID=2502235 RepID=UPI0010F7DFFB|nr:RNA 2',3'-cyclic phosphodiesterase [Chitinivorax sp. B]